MKNLLILGIGLLMVVYGKAQSVRRLTDQHIVNQQERMVFKQWDKKKFTPTKGFLGLNPNYWLTWAWHPNYPKNDLRPLSSSGEQTQRLLLVAAMKNTEEAYSRHADTLRNTTLTEMLNYAGTVSGADPLWQLYYNHEFQSLYQVNHASALQGAGPQVSDYLIRTGLLRWYLDESAALTERLDGARSTNLDRGSRIMAYHRMLDEYRKLSSTWQANKQRAKLFLSLAKTNADQKRPDKAVIASPGRTDIQIADDVLRKSKL
ncbi:hypothetical protein OHD16_15730 [Sphingobacterium sp. ML3W]|uniref:hypothetical protein n=1 Tax=Sphingobacterium sp. ML3W TaxID=1538644 RepID=UPI00249C7E0D|nr:hypothetical protein [Sphingobacterium sp. ML3W]WFA81405.1 hypothetical protein OGI71_08870 [Sphingobacterium sp. ML3W]